MTVPFTIIKAPKPKLPARTVWAKAPLPGAAKARQMCPTGTFHSYDYPETTEANIRAGANDHRQFKSAGRKT